MSRADQIAVRLQQALESGALPAEGRHVGRKLVDQLRNPTRVAVAGLAGAGKTSLVNMLLGERLMPDLPGIAAVELRYGEIENLRVEFADGSQRSLAGPAVPARIPAGAVKVSQELPDPRLKEWSFLEIALPDAGAEARRLLDWMAGQSDVALWCSPHFDDRERVLWSGVPDHLKDHAFLVLTRADRLFMKGALGSRITALQPVVADEFLRLYPVATLQASAAREPGAGVDDALWRSSGGKALLDGLRQQVEAARTADLDHACVLLDRWRIAVPDADEAAEPAPRPASPAPAAAAAKPAPRPDPVPHRPANPPADQRAALDGAVRQALNLLQGYARDLLAMPEGPGSASAGQIVESCSRAADDLARIFTGANDLPPAEAEALREDAAEGQQLLMLLRLERNESAAEDALTVLLQMKKDLSERVAS